MASTKTKKKGKKANKADKANNGRKSANGSRSKGAKTAQAAATNGEAADKPRARPTQDAPADKRQLVQERKILSSQSRWLQKALFALGKAEDDQQKLAELRGETHQPMAVTVDGNTHELGAVTESLRDSVMERLETLRETRQAEQTLMG